MLNVTSYALQYSNVNVAAVAAQGLGLFITEAAPLGGAAAISDADAASLIAAGTSVIGYVDAAVTDDTRPYWNPAWTSNGLDTGTVLDTAPAWLKTGVTNSFGVIVDITDAAWRQLVIDQCVNIVTRGYSGVFLDDVMQYYLLGQPANNVAAMATSMLTLITDIKTAIAAINPDAVLVVNATPYIVTDATGGATSPEALAFLQAADAMLLESYFGIGRPALEDAIDWARTYIQPSMQLLALEYGGTAFQNHLFLQQSAALNILGAVSQTGAFDTLGAPVADASESSDLLDGTFRADVINALAGDDTIRASGGNDIIDGGDGNDVINGGAGDDAMTGGSGDDVYVVSEMADTVTEAFGAGRDLIILRAHTFVLPDNVENLSFGGTGNMLVTGNTLSNVIKGGAANDRFVDVAGGSDVFWGGAGGDTVDYRTAARGVNINLAAGTYQGTAAGDRFIGIENVFGSATTADRLVAGKARMAFYGFGGNDGLVGGAGKDRLSGGDGNDKINGGRNNDVMTGGAGRDIFYFSRGHFGNDTITDFQKGIDKISLAALDISWHSIRIGSNGGRTVAVYILGQTQDSITIKSEKPLFLAPSDFIL